MLLEYIPGAKWPNIGAMELTSLPDAFPAGTTVVYRRQLTDYPADGGWTLKLHLAGASVRSITAAADGSDFVVTIAASVTAGEFTPGLYKWAERVSNVAGEVYEVGAGVVTILRNLAEATEGSEQEWIERAIAALRAHIEGRLPAGMESYQIAGRAVSRIPAREAVALLSSLESRLARLKSPGFMTRPVLVSFTPPGFDT